VAFLLFFGRWLFILVDRPVGLNGLGPLGFFGRRDALSLRASAIFHGRPFPPFLESLFFFLALRTSVAIFLYISFRKEAEPGRNRPAPGQIDHAFVTTTQKGQGLRSDGHVVFDP